MIVEWDRYQACTEVCGAPLGEPCRQLTGFNAARGVHDVEEAAEPHSSRKLRAAAARAGGDRG